MEENSGAKIDDEQLLEPNEDFNQFTPESGFSNEYQENRDYLDQFQKEDEFNSPQVSYSNRLYSEYI